MKKILYGIICIFTLFITSNKVYASSFTLSLNGDEEFSNEISLDLDITGLINFPNGFYGIQGTLNYDKTKLEFVSITGKNGFEYTYDDTKSNGIVIYSETGKPVGTTMVTVKFKNLALADNESTTISITNILGSTSEEDISGSNVTKTITYTAPDYMKGDMNHNGTIDLQDVIYLLKRYLGIETPTQEDILIGDMDDNKSLGLRDVIILLKLYLGIN